jgi:hypothetical protein
MLKIMPDENTEEFSMSPGMLNETVLSMKQFLDKKIQGSEWRYGLDPISHKVGASSLKFKGSFLGL